MEAFDATNTMVYTVRKTPIEEGLDAVLSRKRRETPPTPRIFDGEAEAKLIALARSEPPPGVARWTLRQLGETIEELGIESPQKIQPLVALQPDRDESYIPASVAHSTSKTSSRKG